MTKTKKYMQNMAAIICLILIVRYFTEHSSELFKLINLTGYHFISLLVAIFGIHCISAYKNFMVLRNLQLENISFFSWLKIFTISRFANLHVSQSGNVYRAMILKKDHSFPYTSSISGLAFYAWIELIFVFLISAVVITAVNRQWTIFGVDALLILFPAMLCVIIMPYIGSCILKRMNFSQRTLKWGSDKLIEVSDDILNNTQKPSLLVPLFILSLVAFVLYIWAIYMAFDALGTHLYLEEVTIFTVLILISSVILITPGNIGIMELLYGGLSTTFGLTFGDGILACSLIRILGYVLIAGLTLKWNRSLIGLWDNE